MSAAKLAPDILTAQESQGPVDQQEPLGRSAPAAEYHVRLQEISSAMVDAKAKALAEKEAMAAVHALENARWAVERRLDPEATDDSYDPGNILTLCANATLAYGVANRAEVEASLATLEAAARGGAPHSLPDAAVRLVQEYTEQMTHVVERSADHLAHYTRLRGAAASALIEDGYAKANKCPISSRTHWRRDWPSHIRAVAAHLEYIQGVMVRIWCEPRLKQAATSRANRWPHI